MGAFFPPLILPPPLLNQIFGAIRDTACANNYLAGPAVGRANFPLSPLNVCFRAEADIGYDVKTKEGLVSRKSERSVRTRILMPMAKPAPKDGMRAYRRDSDLGRTPRMC